MCREELGDVDHERLFQPRITSDPGVLKKSGSSLRCFASGSQLLLVGADDLHQIRRVATDPTDLGQLLDDVDFQLCHDAPLRATSNVPAALQGCIPSSVHSHSIWLVEAGAAFDLYGSYMLPIARDSP